MKLKDVIYSLVILTLCLLLWKSCNKSDSFKELYNQSTDTLHQTRNELNQQVTTTALLYGTIDDLKQLHTADSSAIHRLQKMVDKLTISATYLSTTTGNTIVSTTTIIQRDTVYKEGIAYLYPEYRDTIANKWEHFIMAANKDSFQLQYKVFNEFEIKQHWQKNGFLARKTPIAEIINLNPHTETQVYKTFTLQEDKGNRFRDWIIGIAVGAIATETLHLLKKF